MLKTCFVFACVALLSSAFHRPCAHATRVSEALTIDQGSWQMPYRLFAPTGAQTGTTHPLVVYLHGAGERGADNQKQINNNIASLIQCTATQAYNSYLLAPQANTSQTWSNFGGTELSAPMQATLTVIDGLVAEGKVDPNRIYLTGYSMGSYGVFDALAKAPDRFAAAVPLAGGAPTFVAPAIADVPMWAFHGDQDDTVSPAYTQQVVDAMFDAGGSPVFTSVIGGGHNITESIYADSPTGPTQGQLYDWMFSQAIPEPGTVSLLVGLAPLCLLRRSRK